jgi:hypothetical protein
MVTKIDRDRRAEKAAAVVKRLAEMHEHADVLIPMLEESKLDMLILALGIGAVQLGEADDADR